MCDESLFPDASPRFVIVFARARQPKVALLLMLASAKWAFCRWWTRQRFLWQETCARVHDFLRRTMSEPMRLSPVIDIWLGQFSFCPVVLSAHSTIWSRYILGSSTKETRRGWIWSGKSLCLKLYERIQCGRWLSLYLIEEIDCAIARWIFCVTVFMYRTLSLFVFINTKHITIFFVVCLGWAEQSNSRWRSW